MCLLNVVPGDGIEDAGTILEASPEFLRFSLAGFIDVKSIAPKNQDLLAPSKIVDLQATEISYEYSSIILEWTAVGDDFDHGQGDFIRNYELFLLILVYYV